MMFRVLAVLSVTAALVGIPSATQATPGPPCVSRHEYLHVPVGTKTKADLENAWGVRHQGTRMYASDPLPVGTRSNLNEGATLVEYRLCGYRPHQGMVFAFYDANSDWYLAAKWVYGQSPVLPYGP